MAGNRILLVEADDAAAQQLSQALYGSGHHVQWVDNLAQAQAAVQVVSPDVLLMGLPWPERRVLDVLRAVRADGRAGRLPIIALSCYGDTRSLVAALDAGADDYMVKPCDAGELHARIRAALRRCAPQQGDEVLQANGLRLDPLTLGVMAQTEAGLRPISLSPLEFRLLHFLVTHPQRVHSRMELLDRIWGSGVLVGERMVDVHVRKLRVALAGTPCNGRIQTVRGGGYRLVVDGAAC